VVQRQRLNRSPEDIPMKRLNVSRAASAAAIALLAACSDAPTAAVIPADTGPAAMNTYPAPALSVSNSGGYPLISWSALAGATSYEVVLTTTETETNRVTTESNSWTYHDVLGSTTGTSFLDTAHAYTGKSMCSYLNYPIVTRYAYRYRVTATFSGGTSVSTVAAPVAPC
jgi:hypothetical protein